MVNIQNEHLRGHLTEKVLVNPKALEYAPPETKGMILFQLTRHGSLAKVNPQNYDFASLDTLGRRKRAVLTLCRKARSRAEFRNICQHMTADGSKDPAGWQENYAHLRRFLGQGIDLRDMDEQLRDFEFNLTAMYDRLYDEPVLGYPFVDNNQHIYLARVQSGDHEGYLVAGGYDPGPATPEFRHDGNETQPRYA
ncbi:hypothetical protein [Stenotrophomonas humi]